MQEGAPTLHRLDREGAAAAAADSPERGRLPPASRPGEETSSRDPPTTRGTREDTPREATPGRASTVQEQQVKEEAILRFVALVTCIVSMAQEEKVSGEEAAALTLDG